MRLRTLLGCSLLTASACALVVLPVAAGAPPESVEGRTVRVQGVTKQKSDFAGKAKERGFLDLRFGDDRFSARAVAGRYQQKRHKLRFQVDPELLADYEASWAVEYAMKLAEKGFSPDAVACEVRQAKLKGRVRGDEVKFKSTYKVLCEATGDFGRREGKGKVRFRGRGRLDALDVGILPFGSGDAGLGFNLQMIAVSMEEPGGTAGAELTALPAPRLPLLDAP